MLGSVSFLMGRGDGVVAMPLYVDGVVVITRESTRLVDVQRRPCHTGEDGKGIRCVRAAANAKRQREAWQPGELADAVASIEDAAWNPTDVADVAYSRHCEKTGCLRDGHAGLGDGQGCVTGRRADALFKLADKFYYGRYNGGDGGRDASRLGMHPFLSELLRNFKDDVGSKERHLRLYAGHDTVVAPLLAALGVFDGKWPPLASRIVFELRDGGALRILFNGRDVSEEACGAAAADDLEGGPPGARGCHVAAFEARVASLLGGAASFDEACGN